MDYLSLGKKIRDIRIKNNLTQGKLAELSGLSAAHISNIETAHTKASLPALVDIANALSASLDEILCDSLVIPESVCTNCIYQMIDKCSNSDKKIIGETVAALIKSLKSSDS